MNKKDDQIECPWCKHKNWKRQMFGVETNYHTCLNCFANSPPRRTIDETEADIKVKKGK